MISSGNPSIQKASCQAVSVLMNPFYGDSYSYPWKRGPHDNLPEYFEALPTFEVSVREVVWRTMNESGIDWLGKLVQVYQSEDET